MTDHLASTPEGEPARTEEERATLLDHTEGLGASGSWDWTPATGELHWSENHYRLFGVEPGSLTPSVEFLLEHVHPADRERVVQAMDTVAADSEPVEFRIIRADDDIVRRLRVSVTLVDSGSDRPTRFVGVVQDVSAEDSVARKLAAHVAVSRALDEWREFEAGATHLLEGLAGAMRMAFGVLWVDRHTTFLARRIWHLPASSLSALADATLDWTPGRGSPTVGRAWRSRHPVISQQPGLSGTAARKAAIEDAGIVATLAIPAVVLDDTLAVLEFLSTEPIESSGPLLRVLNGLGHEIGYFLGQRRGELAAPVLSQREIQVLQMAARAFTAAEIAQELQLRPATVKRHFERAYANLGVSDRASAVASAMRKGLIV